MHRNFIILVSRSISSSHLFEKGKSVARDKGPCRSFRRSVLHTGTVVVRFARQRDHIDHLCSRPYQKLRECISPGLESHLHTARWRIHTPRSAWFLCYHEAIALKPTDDSSPALLSTRLLPKNLSMYVYRTLGVTPPRLGQFCSITESSTSPRT
jgi:hypothetical protein